WQENVPAEPGTVDQAEVTAGIEATGDDQLGIAVALTDRLATQAEQPLDRSITFTVGEGTGFAEVLLPAEWRSATLVRLPVDGEPYAPSLLEGAEPVDFASARPGAWLALKETAMLFAGPDLAS